MAIIKPFKATRPEKDKVSLVVSRSYEEYSKKELNSILSLNPSSFLHIINPGFKHDKKVRGTEKFRLVFKRYNEFLDKNILKRDNQDNFYLYEIEKDSHKFLGLFCCTSVGDYQDDVIKKHEATIYRREVLFANYLKTVKFNAEPVLITYADNNAIAKILRKEAEKEPEYNFSTMDKATHRLWIISELKTIERLQEEFSKVNQLYIADGHHRSASSTLLAKSSKRDNRGISVNSSQNYFMSYLIPESEIRISGFNRMVRDLNGLSKEEFLIRLDSYFRIKNKGRILYEPSKKHHFCMYMDGQFYSLYLKKEAYHFSDALSKLDTQILFKTVLEPILGIHIGADNRIHYESGHHGIIKIKNEVDKGNFVIGFSYVPITIEEIKAIADEGQVMPAKSTYIEPKLRSGLVIYEL